MILAIDTATRWTGLALYNGTAVSAEMGWHSLNTQTVELVPAIANLLKQSETAVGDLQGIAVAIGPGSYTGLRIGLGVAKGLALAHHTPLVGIGTLDIVAVAVSLLEGQLCVVAEAGRTRICAALYQWHKRHGWQSHGQLAVTTWENLLASLTELTTVAGEITPEAAKQIRAAGSHLRLVSPAQSVRRAGYLAELGWQKLRKGKADNASLLTPNYLRDPAGS